MLHSSGAPDVAAYLERPWAPHPIAPVLNERAHYVAIDSEEHTLPMHMLWLFGFWYILDVDGGFLGDVPLLLYARSDSEALHPNTIHAGEWEVRVRIVSGGEDDVWERMPDFRVLADLEGSTPERPLSLLDIGVDFFLRCRTPQPIWFIDPMSGEAVHSGANAPLHSKDESPGRRFCSLCCNCTLAKNFSSQHLKKVHPDLPWCPEVRNVVFPTVSKRKRVRKRKRAKERRMQE